MPMDPDYGFGRETVKSAGSRERSGSLEKKIDNLTAAYTELQQDYQMLVEKVKMLENEVRILSSKTQ